MERSWRSVGGKSDWRRRACEQAVGENKERLLVVNEGLGGLERERTDGIAWASNTSIMELLADQPS